MIPFLELKPTYLELREELDAAYRRVMESGWYLLGAETEAFEAEFAAYTGTRHCVAVGNGLDAIRIALEAHGIGPGDEVLVPAHTFIATWLAVSQCGATPVGVDVRPDTANLDPELLSGALTPRTRAIVPVHLYGQPADMDPIMEFAARHSLLVVEDAAQAHGARYRGRPCGSLGHAAAFSFYPGKNLGAFSDGGAITTNDGQLARKARMLRNYGSEQRYFHELPGINSRLDELQAAFLRAKLARLDEWNARRAAIAGCYLRELTAAGAAVGLPAVPDWASPVWHLFVIRHAARDLLQNRLAATGVQTIIHYPVPPHQSGVYQRQWEGRAFPAAEALAAEVLSLPIGPQMDAATVETCARAVLSAVREVGSAAQSLSAAAAPSDTHAQETARMDGSRQMVKASLLFVTYRHEKFVADAIRSAMAQDYPNLEIVVCDDASPDATRRILERELESCPPHIRVVRSYSPTNVGLQTMFNRGMDACTGEVIVVMSGDDISLPERVSRMVEEFDRNPRCMVVCSDWKTIDADGVEIPGRGCHLRESGVFRYQGKIKHMYAGAPVCGAAASYRATLRDVFGPMRKGHHAEDNCYWFRGLLTGDIHYVAEPLVLWRSHAQNQSNWDRPLDTPAERAKFFHFLRKHQNFVPQWRRDLATAMLRSMVSCEVARRIDQAIQYDREWQRLRRYSLAVVPMRLWWAAAGRVLRSRPWLKVLRKTVLSQLRIRLSTRRRARFWRRHFGGQHS